MPKVYMNETPVVQTVGAGGIGVSPPVPVEKVEKISGNTRGMEEVVPPVNRIPNPIDVGDGAVIQERNNAWQTGADLPDPTNATDGMVLAVEDGKYIIADASVQTDVADLVADPYDPNSTYDVGDIVVYQNKLYVCKTAITTAEAWTAAHWDEKNMAEALEDGLASQSEKIDAFGDDGSIFTVELGSINSSGQDTSSTTRARTTNKVAVLKGDYVFPLWNQSINAGKYYIESIVLDANGSVISSSGWKDTLYVLPYSGFLRMIIRKRDNSTITNEDLTDIGNSIFYTSKPFNSIGINKNKNNVIGINHRGWHECPENTLIAYKESYEHGFKYVETDVRITSDGVFVCLHDATINRTGRNADGTTISDTIAIGDITYEESQDYDFGIYKGDSFAGTKLPKLEDFLALCKSLNLCAYLDFGTSPEFTKTQIENAVKCVIDAGMQQSVTYLAGVFNYGVWISRYDKYARIGMGSSLNTIFTTYAKAFRTGFNDVFMDTEYTNVDSTTILNAINENLPVEVWTVNTTSYLDSLNSYITGVTSDSINAPEYLAKKNWGDIPYVAPTILYDRATIGFGGYYVKDKCVYVNMKITSKTTASNTPTMFANMPVPQGGNAVLNCVKSTGANAAYMSEAIMCSIYDDDMYIRSVVTDADYYITGSYLME